jgi:hypothetical protein
MKIHASMSLGGGGDRSEGLGRPLAGFRRGWRPPLSRGQAWRGRGLKRPWTGRCERRARAYPQRHASIGSTPCYVKCDLGFPTVDLCLHDN